MALVASHITCGGGRTSVYGAPFDNMQRKKHEIRRKMSKSRSTKESSCGGIWVARLVLSLSLFSCSVETPGSRAKQASPLVLMHAPSTRSCFCYLSIRCLFLLMNQLPTIKRINYVKGFR